MPHSPHSSSHSAPGRSGSSRQRCSRCGGEVKRVHRQPHDEQATGESGLRRYRCLDDSCGWQGLLSKPQRRASNRAAQPGALWWRPWIVLLLLLAVVALGVMALAARALRGEQGTAAVHQGTQHHDGRPPPEPETKAIPNR